MEQRTENDEPCHSEDRDALHVLAAGLLSAPATLAPGQSAAVACHAGAVYGAVEFLSRRDDEEQQLEDDTVILRRLPEGRWEDPSVSSGTDLPDWVLPRPGADMPYGPCFILNCTEGWFDGELRVAAWVGIAAPVVERVAFRWGDYADEVLVAESGFFIVAAPWLERQARFVAQDRDGRPVDSMLISPDPLRQWLPE